MSQGSLTIYNASAGSGKTHTLTGIYLGSLFQSRHNYRKILAVTFTNKATAEMKSRILENLHKLATGEKCEYLESLALQTKKSEEWIRNEAGEILNSILHDFSRFHVSTIDSFFQKILRAFAREAGLHSGFNIELDHEILLSAAVDEMMSSAANDKQLRSWLIRYAEDNIEDEKSWNLREGIIKLSGELFREKFKILSADEMTRLGNKEFLTEYIGKLKSICHTFEKQLPDYGKQAQELTARFGVTDEMFYRKGQGIPKFIRNLLSCEAVSPNCYAREITNDPPRWSTGAVSPQLKAALENGLSPVLVEAIAFYDRNIIAYKTSKAIRSNIYALGILSDVLHNIHTLTTSENTFLLSDAGELLSLITKGDQCPFIYEKVGNKFENFMIDEFQDTSIIQWNNFSPLIENSMAQGSDNLVVGDIKQSIYRWRNSDWQILGSLLDSQSSDGRMISRNLTTNWRSRGNIIKFNNALFSILPSILDEKLEEDVLPVKFSKLYSQAVQTDPGKKPGGYINIEFIENEEEKTWEQKILEKLPSIIESVQDKGYETSDIGIIVRDGREGSMVLKALIDYSNSCPEEHKRGYNYNVVSSDSLLLSASPVINFIVSVISVVNDPSDKISAAAMARFYLLATGRGEEVSPDCGPEDPDRLFHAGYRNLFEIIRQIPLYEAVEEIISFFGLGSYPWNAAFISTFQDHVLRLMGSGNPGLRMFLEWWETTGQKKSVVLPGDQQAMRILTIHKSKGLEFGIVILPFISWNLDHPPFRQPLLWVRPDVSPFNELGVVPVKCNKDLAETIFSAYYREEKYSVHLDNLNLLYVAMTRAKDAIFGFSINNPSRNNTIAGILKEAFLNETYDVTDLKLYSFYDKEKNLMEFGELTEKKKSASTRSDLLLSGYPVNRNADSLRLKLHGENYFSPGDTEKRKKINYGNLMHEVFEGIDTTADIPAAIRQLVLEGKLPSEEAVSIETKVRNLLSDPSVAGWFSEGNTVMREAGILLTSGNIRRPDRVIFRDGRTTVIDFKFGEENEHHIEQVELYRGLLVDMGYGNIDACIWYVDKNKIVTA